MLNLSDTYLASDHATSVALYLTADDRVFLVHRHRTPGRCFLHSPVLAHALRTVYQDGTNELTLHLELRPLISGLSRKPPFMAFIGARDRIVLAYLPTKLTQREAEAVFDTFPGLPVLVSDTEEFFVSDAAYQRIATASSRSQHLASEPKSRSHPPERPCRRANQLR